MKRASSRASRTAIESLDSKENFRPSLLDVKWKEIFEKEENDMFILGIREHIVETSMKICYENYLQRQTIAFTVHCAHLAFSKVIGVYYMLKDPDDFDDPIVKDSWEADSEPEPSLIDSWASQCIKPVKPEIPKKEEKVQVEETVILDLDLESVKSSPPTNFLYEEEGECYYPTFVNKINSFLPLREKSIFSQTLSMSKQSLPLVEPLNSYDCRTFLSVNRKKNKNK